MNRNKPSIIDATSVTMSEAAREMESLVRARQQNDCNHKEFAFGHRDGSSDCADCQAGACWAKTCLACGKAL